MAKIKQDIGLAVLSASAVFGAWSAWNSSFFTIATFTTDEQKIRDARTAMLLGLGTAIMLGLGIRGVFGKKANVASYTAIATGITMYVVYEYKLQQQTTKINSTIQTSAISDKENLVSVELRK